MSSVIVNTRAALAMLLTCASLASVAHGATMDDELLVDPTMPLGWGAGEEGDGVAADADDGSFALLGQFTTYQLKSVLIRSEDRMAVINDTRVRVGDRVGSAVVTAIESDHVSLNVDGEVRRLERYKDSIKTPVKGDE